MLAEFPATGAEAGTSELKGVPGAKGTPVGAAALAVPATAAVAAMQATAVATLRRVVRVGT
jgi:hypothetical protein